jgi:hypothetical protein
MSIQMMWMNETRTAMLIEFPQRWQWPEFYEAKVEIDKMLDTVDHPCALIIALPPNVIMPDNVISNARSMFKQKHPLARVFMLVAPNTFARALLNMFARLVGETARSLWVVPTQEEAEARLVRMGYLEPEKVV